MDKHSATLGLSGQREVAIALAGDHRTVCKFSEPSSAYQQVEDDIAALAEDALQARFENNDQASFVQPPTCKYTVHFHYECDYFDTT